MPRWPDRTLAERLWAKVDRNGPLPPAAPHLGRCWIFTGALSQSGRRGVFYGIIREAGAGSRRWRVGRLVLILTAGILDVVPDEGEDFLVWLGRARRYYQDLEASHLCDNARCANPDHLAWETHQENLARQKARKALVRVA